MRAAVVPGFGTRLDLAEVFELHAVGRTRVIRTTRRLDEVNDHAHAAVFEAAAGPIEWSNER